MPAGRRANPMPKDQPLFTEPKPKVDIRQHRPDRTGTGKPRDLLSQTLRKWIDDDTAKAIASAVIDRAVAGDPRFIEFIFNRLEGKAIDRVESGKPGDHDKLLDGITEEVARNVIEAAERFRAAKEGEHAREEGAAAAV